MANYVEENLAKGERIIGKMQFNPKAIITSVLFLVICIIAGVLLAKVEVIACVLCIAVGIIPLICVLVIMKNTYLVITNKRLMGKIGVFKRVTYDIPISNVDNIMQSATFLGKLFHYATLEIVSCGGRKLRVTRVSNANEFKNTLTEAIDVRKEESVKLLATEIASVMGK